MRKKFKNIIRDWVTSKEIESIIKTLPTDKSLEPDAFTDGVYYTFKEEIISILLKLFQKNGNGRKTSKLILHSQRYFDPKARQHPIKKENYRPISLMNMDVKILTKILANRIQQYMKRIIHHDKWDLFQGCKVGSTSTNQSMWYNTLIKERTGHLGGSVDWATAFNSGHDPRLPGSSPALGSQLLGESASPSDLLLSHALSHSLSLK